MKTRTNSAATVKINLRTGPPPKARSSRLNSFVHTTQRTIAGKGSFGKVFLVRVVGREDEVYAMKVLLKSEVVRRKQIEHTKTERRVMGSLAHPFIVALRFAFQTKDKLFMV